jgi:hypothetical protein
MVGWQRYFVPEVTLLYDYSILPRRLRPPTCTVKNTAEIFVTQTHALSTSLYWKKTLQPRPDENKHFSLLFLWERWVETKVNIFEKSGKKTDILKSHSFTLWYATCRSLTKKTSVEEENTEWNPSYVRLEFPGAGKGERIRSLYSWAVFITYQ